MYRVSVVHIGHNHHHFNKYNLSHDIAEHYSFGVKQQLLTNLTVIRTKQKQFNYKATRKPGDGWHMNGFFEKDTFYSHHTPWCLYSHHTPWCFHLHSWYIVQIRSRELCFNKPYLRSGFWLLFLIYRNNVVTRDSGVRNNGSYALLYITLALTKQIPWSCRQSSSKFLCCLMSQSADKMYHIFYI